MIGLRPVGFCLAALASAPADQVGGMLGLTTLARRLPCGRLDRRRSDGGRRNRCRWRSGRRRRQGKAGLVYQPLDTVSRPAWRVMLLRSLRRCDRRSESKGRRDTQRKNESRFHRKSPLPVRVRRPGFSGPTLSQTDALIFFIEILSLFFGSGQPSSPCRWMWTCGGRRGRRCNTVWRRRRRQG